MRHANTLYTTILSVLFAASAVQAQDAAKGAAPAAQPAAAGEKTDTAAAAEDVEIGPVRIGLDAVTVWQNLDVRRDGWDARLESGFQAALGNLRLSVELAPGIDVFTELYLSSKHHPGYVMDREGYLLLSRLPDAWDKIGVNRVFEVLDVKAGHFEVDFGNVHYFRSDNAQVQRNPLIGNYVVDPNTVEGGAEFIGTFGPVRALFGLGGGLTTEDFQTGTGMSWHGKIWLQPGPTIYESDYSISASVYRSDQSGTETGYPKNGTYTELFAGNRSGERYGGPFLAPRPGLDPDFGQIKPGAGQDVWAWQVDALLDRGPLFVLAAYGWTKDADVNGFEKDDSGAPLPVQTTPEDEWSYYSAEAAYDLLPGLYVAGRYSGARASTIMGQDADGHVGRWQFGVGFRLLDQVLMKLEYVDQRYEDFTSGAFANDLRFSGFVAEGSVSF